MLQTFKAIEAPVQNGIAAQLDAGLVRRPALGPTALRRLLRLQAKVDGATEVAQAAVNAHNTVREAYQQAFASACEDASIEIPSGPHEADIDWANGAVRFIPRHD